MCAAGCTYPITVTDSATDETSYQHCGVQCVESLDQSEEQHPIRCSFHRGN